MKINQALKLKNKLVARLNVLKTRMLQNNSIIKGSNPTYNSEECFKEYSKVQLELVTLKARISIATQPMFEHILRMGEYKSDIKILKGMNVKEGVQAGYGTTTEYICTISEKRRDEIIELEEQNIEIIQDKLDQFNATTEI
jgi:predicted DNA-binding ArsR family transcriptional regulator